MQLRPSHLITLSRLLDEAMDLHPDQVEAWLAGLPEQHEHLRPRLEEMLSAHRQSSNPGFMAEGPKLADAPDETIARTGELVGPYRLIREIGRGGMGAVWLAERADGTLKRHIALKLPRLAWGAGLAERMARERDIGALLEHPNIARLYDAGVDAKGRPYLALEYIDGQPLDAWCEAQALPTRDRLQLFVQVAKAVAYAHGRLVVHRDLKPSNVLVTADGQAHLLDFGIAKLLHEAGPGDDQLTQEQGRVLTPHYATPEQIRGETITVASDVYSLGVLLYELLTGRYPYEPQSKSLAAIELAISNDEPPVASTRAQDRQTVRTLRGEVDAILAKALKREPDRRYFTADAFAEDVERHLRGDAVQAQPDSLGYRVAKTLRRHRVSFAAGAAVLLAVLGGAGVSVVQAQRANVEADRARLVKEFVVDIFDTQGGPDGSLSQMPAQSLLERGAKMIDGKFAGQPLLQAELYGVVSQMFFNIANFEPAIAYGTRQVETLNTAGAERLHTAKATLHLGEMLNEAARYADAEVRLRRAITLAEGDAGMQVRGHAAMALAVMSARNDMDAAGAELDAADALMAREQVPATDRAAALSVRAESLSDPAEAQGGPSDKARVLFDKAIALALAAEGQLSKQAVNIRLMAARACIRANQEAAGKAYLNAALTTMRAGGGPDDVNAALSEARYTGMLFGRGAIPFAQALETIERDLAALRAHNPPLPAWYVAHVEYRLGLLYLDWGDIEHGYPLVARTLQPLWQQVQGAMSEWWGLNSLVLALSRSDRVAEAEPAAREMLTIGRRLLKADELQDSYYPLVAALMHARRYAEAETELSEFDALPGIASRLAKEREARATPDEVRMLVPLERGDAKAVVEMTDTLKPKDGIHVDEVAWLARAAALCATGRSEEGLSLFATWVPRLATDRYEASPHVAYWRARMGLCALQAGQRQRAVEASAMATSAISRQPGVSPHYKAPVRELEMRLRRL